MNATETLSVDVADSRTGPIFHHCRWDGLLVALALLHGIALLLVPSLWLIALGIWWNSNTVAHNFIHLPFFRARPINRLFSAYLSALLGVPQALWRQRHLAHHAGHEWRLQVTPQLALESVIVGAVWLSLLFFAPRFFVGTYLPGYLLGLGLCWLQGHYEHARGTTSHYGRVYNCLFFNDGYHVEHHAQPARHWRSLPRHDKIATGSRWPAALRWLESFPLHFLERLVVHSPRLQRFVLETHESAFRRILPILPRAPTIGIVGGAMFPRTALILQKLLPDAHLTIIDANARNIAQASRFLGENVRFENAWFDSAHGSDFDLLVIPLSFVGDRKILYRQPPAPTVLIHDWLWRTWPASTRISFALMKRLNLVTSATNPPIRGAHAHPDESA
jgi:hypothetical protein